jgi:hypothetical protein
MTSVDVTTTVEIEAPRDRVRRGSVERTAL